MPITSGSGSDGDFIDDERNTQIAQQLVDSLIQVKNTVGIGITANPGNAKYYVAKRYEIDEMLLAPLFRALEGDELGNRTYIKIKLKLASIRDFMKEDPNFGPNNYAFKQLNEAISKVNASDSFWDWLAEHQSPSAVRQP